MEQAKDLVNRGSGPSWRLSFVGNTISYRSYLGRDDLISSTTQPVHYTTH